MATELVVAIEVITPMSVLPVEDVNLLLLRSMTSKPIK